MYLGRWDENEEFYLNELAPGLLKNPNVKSSIAEKEIFRRLQKVLPPNRWDDLPKLLQQARVEKKERELLEERRVQEQRQLEEVQRQKEIKFEQDKERFLFRLHRCFEQNFLQSLSYYKQHGESYLSFTEFVDEKKKFIWLWAKQAFVNSDFPLPDKQQAAAIGSVNAHTQVIARAGSGKTTTLIQRAVFLQKHCGVAPHEILLLAFNTKAATQMHDKLKLNLGNFSPQAMTFHALAYALVHPEENPLVDEPDGGQAKSRLIQVIIDDFIRNPNHYLKVRQVMLAYFREDWERILLGGYDKTPEEMLIYRRSLPKEGLDGNYYKSYGEKLIGDFLFENGLNYKYERNFIWNGINYRPDFTVFEGSNSGIVIEYFGLSGDPDYDEMSEHKRKFWRAKKGWDLLEFTPADISPSAEFLLVLKKALEKNGIRCEKQSEKEIWYRIKDRTIDRFTRVITNFIGRCRKLHLDTEQLCNHISEFNNDSETELAFLNVAAGIYENYLEQLQETGDDDFDGLLQKAASLVLEGKTSFKRRSGRGDLRELKFVFIDEYQDFSYLFYKFIEAIKQQAPDAQFFCVGDDWQAINGFAGSDLRFYSKFDHYFESPEQIVVPTNYRSADAIVKIGNTLMQGLGTPARVSGLFGEGKVMCADLKTFNPSSYEEIEHSGDVITPAVLRLIDHCLKQEKSVVLLSRTKTIPWYVNTGDSLDDFISRIRSYFSEELGRLVSISTTHKYKGLQEDVVIVVDAVERRYPLIHPDSVFTRVFGDTMESIVAEEQRLFYVALTRAKEQLIILTEQGSVSPFLQNIMLTQNISPLDWSKFAQVSGSTRRVTIRIQSSLANAEGGTFEIKDLLKAEGYRWESQQKSWRRSVPKEEFSVETFFSSSLWIRKANGVEVHLFDEYEKMLGQYKVENGVATAFE